MRGLGAAADERRRRPQSLKVTQDGAFIFRGGNVIDYDLASATYDNTRRACAAHIELMARRGAFAARDAGARGPRVLDFGCGTGNYLDALRSAAPGCELFGLEPSDSMLEKARAKNPGLRIEKGDHVSMPFEDGLFDFIYMTDVVHHVPDLDLLFETLCAKLSAGGLVCVVTESHAQIEARWYNAYFPSLAANEKSRYPDIAELERKAAMAGLVPAEIEVYDHAGPNAVDASFLRMVAEKNYSMFRLLGEAEYEAGCAALKADEGKSILSPGAGETLLWLEKGAAP
jgi:SAM-dependent methyltransferase